MKKTSLLKISRLEAAKRQLETAIGLYFNRGDPVSIHTLASAAYKILTESNEKYTGPPSTFSDFPLRENFKRRFEETIREPHDFCHRARCDSEEMIDLNTESAPFYIYDAISNYQEIAGDVTPHFRVFRGWFCMKHIDSFLCPKEEKDLIVTMKNKYSEDKSTYFAEMLFASQGL